MATAAAAMLCLAACGAPSSVPAPTRSAAAGPRAIVDVYPTAHTVRLFVLASQPNRDHSEYRQVWLNPPGGFPLTADQARRVRSHLRDEPEPDAIAACFIPHHFFRFYDVAGRKVGEVSVCLCCAGAQASPVLVSGPGRQLGFDYEAVQALVSELGAKVDVDCEGEL